MTLDLDAPFAPHNSMCLKLHLSTSHITLTSQLRPPPMSWEVKPEVAHEIWSGLESANPVLRREHEPCPVLKASVVFRTFGAESSPSPASDPNLAMEALSLLAPSAQTCGRRWTSYSSEPLEKKSAKPR